MMPEIIDELEQNQSQNRDYLDNISDEEQAIDMSTPEFKKPVIPALEIAMGIVGAVWLAISFFT